MGRIQETRATRAGEEIASWRCSGDVWLIADFGADIQAAGTRIAVLDAAGNLFAKDGIGAPWLNEAGGVSQYALTPNLLVVRS